MKDWDSKSETVQPGSRSQETPFSNTFPNKQNRGRSNQGYNKENPRGRSNYDNYRSKEGFNRGSSPFGAGSKCTPPKKPLTAEEEALVKKMGVEVKEFVHDLNKVSAKMENNEQDFLKNIIDKNITIYFISGKSTSGLLKDVDKYKIMVEIAGKTHYYYKHSLLGYNAD